MVTFRSGKYWKKEFETQYEEIIHLNKLLEFSGESERYKDDIIRSQNELLIYKDLIIEKLRGQIEELKLL